MPRDAILFDLDGTLVDSALDIAAALSRLSLARGGWPITPETVRPLVSLGAANLVARALGPTAGDSAVDVAAFRALLGGVGGGIVFEGVAEALALLDARGYRMAVVTNKPEALAIALLDAQDLRQWFRIVVGGDTTAFPKPHPAPVRHALDGLGVTAARTLFVGDSDVDARAARALSIPFVLYTLGYGGESVAKNDIAGDFSAFADLPNTLASIA